jgi:Protein of unknown function (DUF1579)
MNNFFAQRRERMKRTVVVLALIVICGVLVLAQAPQAPKPGPEQQKLAAFIGNWTFVGEAKAGPMGKGGKITGTDRIQWLPGGFFIERRFEGKAPWGEMNGLEIIGYDSAKKVYTYSVFDNMGAAGSGTMTLSGNTWNLTGTMNLGGKSMQERCTLTLANGGASLHIKCDTSTEGTTWTPSFEGKATKSAS